MIFYKLSDDLREEIKHLRASGKRIGFVPTMGALHQGHISLIQASALACDVTVCSIFVNPSQFNNAEDLKHYPRTLANDLELLAGFKNILVYAPDEVNDVYKTDENFAVELGNIGLVMEAAFRPGHFNGVMNVVKRLFDIVTPDMAFFGQKDFQQCLVIKKLINHYLLPVELKICPIAREEDGLAMSSRNVRLSPAERAIAPAIFKALMHAKEQVNLLTPDEVKNRILNELKSYRQLVPEYVEISETENLLPVESWNDARNIVACITVKLGAVRLIDNIILK
ncbi:MAG: pantoate--beta-alanine ligase [Bacteroidia bacterium]|nr:pantoate--beta-alanine ligase [Bacteroidia bacterium]